MLKEPTKVENQTGISTNPLGFDSSHPPQYDVWKRPIKCSFDSSTDTATATGTVQNHSSHPSSYLLGIAFKRGSTQVGDGVDIILHVDPGHVASWSAQGSVTGSGHGLVLGGFDPALRQPGAGAHDDGLNRAPAGRDGSVLPPREHPPDARPWQQARLGTGLLPAVTGGCLCVGQPCLRAARGGPGDPPPITFAYGR